MDKKTHRSPGVRPSTPFTFARYTVPHEEHQERNEDKLLIDPLRGLTAAFDGVGERQGYIAARLAARVIQQCWKRIMAQVQSTPALLEESNSIDIQDTLRQLIKEAHEQIKERGLRLARAKKKTAEEKQQARQPETTVTLAVFCRNCDASSYTMTYAHVGDSRIYHLGADDTLHRLTQDDGYLSILLEQGTINEEDILRIDQATAADQLTETEREYFNKRNGITQSLGYKAGTIHLGQTTVMPGDRVLLCTDGIHDNLTDAEIADILKAGTRTTVAKLLVQSAVKRSHADGELAIRAKQDDMSAIVVTCNF